MRDPQKPSYTARWCLRCKAHTEYTKHSYGSGESRTTHYKCDVCNYHVTSPLGNIAAIALLLLVTAWINGFLIRFYINEWNVGMLLDPFYKFSLVFIHVFANFLLSVYYYIIGKDHVSEYRKWKKWAKERGWEEEKT